MLTITDFINILTRYYKSPMVTHTHSVTCAALWFPADISKMSSEMDGSPPAASRSELTVEPVQVLLSFSELRARSGSVRFKKG